jgi:hypothetical protein
VPKLAALLLLVFVASVFATVSAAAPMKDDQFVGSNLQPKQFARHVFAYIKSTRLVS